MTFKEKVQSMTAKEIIMAMVEALTHPPIINVNMKTFGEVDEKGVCFGCAATNTVCQISGMVFTKDNITNRLRRSTFIDGNEEGCSFLYTFENAIDALRLGRISTYNGWARLGKFAEIVNFEYPFPSPRPLYNDYTNEELIPYKELAERQELQPVS